MSRENDEQAKDYERGMSIIIWLVVSLVIWVVGLLLFAIV